MTLTNYSLETADGTPIECFASPTGGWYMAEDVDARIAELEERNGILRSAMNDAQGIRDQLGHKCGELEAAVEELKQLSQSIRPAFEDGLDAGSLSDALSEVLDAIDRLPATNIGKRLEAAEKVCRAYKEWRDYPFEKRSVAKTELGVTLNRLYTKWQQLAEGGP